MATNLLDLMGYMQDQGDRGRALGQQSKLAQLASQAYGAPQDQRQGLVQQAIGVDPQSGFALGQNLQGDEDARMKRVGQMAGMLVNLPSQARPQAYAGIVRELQGIGLGEGLPDQWSDDLMPYAQQLAGQLGGVKGAEGFTLSPGSARYDAQGRMVVSQPFAPKDQNWAVEEVPDGMGGTIQMEHNRATGEWREPTYGAVPSVPLEPPQMGGDQFAFLGGIPGVTITSGQRTPEHNREVGGAPNSYHLTGQARDILPPRDPQQAALIRQQAAANGLEVIDEGDHWHMEPRGNASRRLGYAPPKASKDDSAPNGYRFRPDGALEAIPGGPADPNTVKPLPPAQRAKLEQTKKKELAMLDGADAKFKAIEDDIKWLSQRDLGDITGLWRTDWIPGSEGADTKAKLDSLLAKSAFGYLQQMRAESPTGGALGQVSNIELELLKAAQAALQQSQSAEQFRENLDAFLTQVQESRDRLRRRLDEYYTDQGLGQQQAQAPQSGGVLRYNPATGDFE